MTIDKRVIQIHVGKALRAKPDTMVYYLTCRIVFVPVTVHSKRKPGFTESQWAS
jgi:hypothetical protein